MTYFDMSRMSRRRVGALLAGAGLLGPSALLAQQSPSTWPQPGKPIRFLVPLAAGGSLDVQTRAVARRLTELTAHVLGKHPEVTAVVIEELWPGRWFIGGRNPGTATALLEIRITEGTNSAEEKQAFVQAAYEELWQQLGPLAEASYVVVQEVKATDWGYGGKTQAERKVVIPA